MSIRLGLYSHTIDYAGTWRSHERIAEILQKNSEYEVFVFYSDIVENSRLEDAKKILKDCTFVPFERTKQKTGSDSGWSPLKNNIDQAVKDHKIDILHFARSGYYEWPFTSRLAPVQIETNIFGYQDSSNFLDGSIVISEALRLSPNERREIIYNPIPRPSSNFSDIKSLREELQISQNSLVFGRIGRPSNFTPVSLIAYANFVKYSPNSKYVIIGPCKEAKLAVSQLNIESKVIFLDPTNDDEYIERFHKTIDIFAHYRSDGETFGTAIAQAMIYGIPVITHFAGQNGQALTIGEGGFCVSSHQEYESKMRELSNRDVMISVGKSAEKHARTHYDQRSVVDKIDKFYRKIARLKGCDF